MTIVIWAASDEFALLVADRRAISSKPILEFVTPTPKVDQGFALDLFVKANLSEDQRDIVGFSGEAAGIGAALHTVLGAHGPEGDHALNAQLNEGKVLDDAHTLDVSQEPSNAMLHCYSRDGKMVCSRFEWTRTQRHWLVIGSKPERIQVTAIGSGAPYMTQLLAVPAENQKWRALEGQVSDPTALHAYLVRIIGTIAALHDGVSVATSSWLLRRGASQWVELDGSTPTAGPSGGMSPLPGRGTSPTDPT